MRKRNPQAERALDLRRRALGEEHHDTVDSMLLLARVYRGEGKYGDAEPLVAGAVRIRNRTLGERNTETLMALKDLASLYMDESKLPRPSPSGCDGRCQGVMAEAGGEDDAMRRVKDGPFENWLATPDAIPSLIRARPSAGFRASSGTCPA